MMKAKKFIRGYKKFEIKQEAGGARFKSLPLHLGLKFLSIYNKSHSPWSYSPRINDNHLLSLVIVGAA